MDTVSPIRGTISVDHGCSISPTRPSHPPDHSIPRQKTNAVTPAVKPYAVVFGCALPRNVSWSRLVHDRNKLSSPSMPTCDTSMNTRPALGRTPMDRTVLRTSGTAKKVACEKVQENDDSSPTNGYARPTIFAK